MTTYSLSTLFSEFIIAGTYTASVIWSTFVTAPIDGDNNQ